MNCCSPFDVVSVSACDAASNVAILPVATSEVDVDFVLAGLDVEALVCCVAGAAFAADEGAFV